MLLFCSKRLPVNNKIVYLKRKDEIFIWYCCNLNRNDKYLPLAFTEQGVAMLSGILNSSQAIMMNISIMRAFVEVRKIALTHKDIKKQITEIRKKVGIHDIQLTNLYEAIENLLSEKASEIKWNERAKIGYKKE